MSCSNLTLNNYPKLRSYIENNVAIGTQLYNDYLATVGTAEFQKALDKKGVNAKTSPKQAFEILKEVYNAKIKNLQSLQEGIDKHQTGRFTSKLAKIEALDFIASNISKVYSNDKFNATNKYKSLGDIINDFKSTLIRFIEFNVKKEINNNDELKEEYNKLIAETSRTIALKNIIEKLDNNILRNQLAAFESLSDKTFIEELKMKRDVAALYGQIDLEFEAVEDENKGSQEEEGSNTEDVDTVDDMSKSWELNIGEKSDFKGHIEEVVKYKLNSIPKLISIDYTLDKKGNPVYQYDRGAEAGFIQFMDGQYLAGVLFTETDKSSVDNFVNSIADIAKRKSNLKGFITLYNDLKADKNLAYKFMMVFDKPVIPKVETYYDYQGGYQVRISNLSSNPTEIVVNDIKLGIKNADETTLQKFNIDIKDATIEDVHEALKLIVPDIDYQSLQNMADNYKDEYKSLLYNIATISKIISDTINNKNNYIEKLSKGEDVSDLNSFIPDSYLPFIYEFSKKIAPYTNVKVNLNSRNGANNLSSDVINRSYLTNFPLIFSSEEGIETYARQKFAGTGYNYSNVLIERVSSTGKLQPGLFRKVGDVYKLTEYANELVKISLVNGSADRRTNTSVLYKDMSKGDYLLTGLMNYVKNEEKTVVINGQEHKFATANFFMSIPSDTPKTFVATMPILSLDGLYKYNEEQYNRFRQEATNKVNALNVIDLKDEKYTDWLTNKLNVISSKNLVDLINGEKINIPVNVNNYYKVGNNPPSFAFVDKHGAKYAIAGQLKEINGQFYLTNAVVKGLISDGRVTKTQVNNSKLAYINNQIYLLQRQNIGIEFDINHPVVDALRNIIYQEILDAYTSARRIFKEDANGNLIMSEGQLVLKDDYNANELYLNYEKNRNGKVYDIVDGKYVLTGAVFKLSDLNSKFADVSFYHNLMGNGKVIDVLYGDREKRVKVENGKVVFDANYQTIVDNAINETIKTYLDSYLKNATNYLRGEFSTFLENFSDENIREYLINTIINQVNYDHLFNGKSKFYKGNQDVLKRLKEIQAGGSPFGVIDFTRTSTDPAKIVQETIDIPTADGKKAVMDYTTKEPIKLYDKFKAVTVYNTNKTSRQEVIDRLEKQLNKAKLSEETKASLLKPFKDEKTKTNDAQSYITQEEWIRRITAAGELNKYASLIEALTNDTPIEEIDWTAFENKVPIQKNFYYDLYYDTKTGIEVPRQIKNAEFVLLPKLIKGTELEQVYNAMKEVGIDQLNTIETSKAANHNIITLWDNDGNIHLDEFKEQARNVIEPYSYNYLYRQQEVPEHMVDEENKAGIQILKKMLDNLPNDEYHNNLVNKFFNNYTTNIKQSFVEVATELGIELDNSGNIKLKNGAIVGLNRKVFLQLVKENMAKNGADRVLMEFIDTALEGSDQLPLFMNNIGTKLENVTNALFNKRITRQTIEGWHAAQLSDFGFTVDKDTVKDSEYLANKSNNLENYDMPKISFMPKRNFIIGKIIDNPIDAANICDNTQIKTLNAIINKFGKPNRKGGFYVKPVTIWAKSPINDSQIHHSTVAVRINGEIYLYDMPQSEYIKYNKENSGTIIKEYTPRLIKYTKENLINLYNTSEENINLQDEVLNDDDLINIPIKNIKDKISINNKLEYRKEGEINGVPVYYAEIRLRRWSDTLYKTVKQEDGTTKKIPIDINEVPEDSRTMIGYRIPTEGKQSIVIMKVVEFLPDAYGSTVVVPDEWVTQTGSDFDVDSVYAMTKHVMLNKDGKVVEPTENDYPLNEKGYIRYIKDNIGIAARKALGKYNGQIDSTIKFIKDKEKEEKDKRNELFKSELDDVLNDFYDIKSAIYVSAKDTQNEEKFKLLEYIGKKTKEEKAIDYINKLIGKLETAKINDEFQSTNKLLDILLDYAKDVQQLLDDKTDLEVEEYQGKNERIRQAIEDGRKKIFDESERFANENGLPNYVSWLSLPVEERVSRDVRNNNIVQTFIDILNSPAAFEENMGISQFSNLADANSWMADIAKISNKHVINDKSYGNHDAVTQLDWKESASSGIKLKAISVNLDTFASIGNRTKIRLPFAIPVRYDKETIGKQKIGEKDRFGKIENNVINFTNQGWSEDNKNVEGYLLTPYSSQTTAHILDVMKEGAIHNENTYTFNVFKVMINAGIDYKTAISFMYQPAMDNLVKYWNESQSFANNEYINPLTKALDDAATALGITTEGKNINDLASAVYRKYNEKEYITNVYGDVGFPIIDRELNVKRFSNEMTEEEKKIHDFMVLLQFNKLNQLGNIVNNTLSVLTADKFGAKPSYYATDRIFRQIDDILTNDDKLYAENKKGEIVPVVEAIYPGISKGIDNFAKADIKNSSYPSLAAMLKYSSVTALKVGQQVFETAEPNFVELIYDVAKYTKNGKLSEKLYNDYKKYLVKRLYVNDNNPAIIYPISLDDDGGVLIKQSSTGKLQIDIENEMFRIAGVGNEYTKNIDFKIADINNPTKEEILAFAKLSPAQKVLYIKENFNNVGIFDFISVNKFNEFTIKQKGYISNELKLNQGNYTNDYLYDLFDLAYLSSNPIIRLTAIDLVKYTYVVEGNNFKAGNIARTISTLPLKPTNVGGMNIGFSTKLAFDNYRFVEANTNISEELIIGFVRQNYDDFPAKFIDIDKIIKKNVNHAQNIKLNDDGSITVYTYDTANIKDFNKLGLLNKDEAYKIIKIRRGNTAKLYYGINHIENVTYYPLNKLDEIDTNKTIEDSSVARNNVYKSLFDVVYGYRSEKLAEQYALYKDKFIGVTEITIDETNNINEALAIINNNFFDKPQLILRNTRFTEDKLIINNAINGKKYVATKITEEVANNFRGSINKVHQDYIDFLNKYPNYKPESDYGILPVVEYGKRYSSIGERDAASYAIKQTVAIARQESFGGNKLAESMMKILNNANINYKDTKEIANNLPVASSTVAKFVKATADRLIYDAYHFTIDENGNELKLNDARVIERVLKDNNLERKFITLINTITSFKDRYSFSNINVEGYDEDTKAALETIKEAINKLNNDTIVLQAKRSYWREFINSSTTNPNIKSGLQEALTFYGDTGFFDLNIQDIAFNHNQLVQAVVGESQAIIKEGEFRGKIEAQQFTKMLSDLKAEAAKNGKSIDWNKIVDENGRLVQPNNKEWFEMKDKLNKEYINAVDETKDKFSIKALRAKLEYDAFIAATTESQFIPVKDIDIDGNEVMVDYTRETIANQYAVLYNKNPKVAELYAEYKRLMKEQSDVLSNMIGNTPTEEQDEKIHQIYLKLRLMTSDFDDNYEIKDEEDLTAARTLQAFIDRNRYLKELFFNRNIKVGFEEQLNNALKTISDIEGARDHEGRLLVPMNILMQNKEYRKAKAWLRANAMYKPDANFINEINACLTALSDPTVDKTSALNIAIEQANARDEFGILDGRKFTAEQIERIKKETVRNFHFSKRSGLPYAGILRSQDDNVVIYKYDFYDSLRNDKVKSEDEIEDIEAINKILDKVWDSTARVLNTGSDKLTIDDLNKLSKLLELYDLDKTKNKKAAEFIAEECVVTYNNAAYEADRARAYKNGDEWYQAWKKVFETVNDEGNVVPNTIFYGVLKPKDENKWIDKNKTDYIRLINKHVQNTKTQYYYEVMRTNRDNMSKEEFKKWYFDNHYYNPYSRQYEPLKIWTHTEYIDESGNKAKGKWEARINQTDLEPNKDYINEKYDKNYPTYKEGSTYKAKQEDGTRKEVNYDNSNYKALNEYELKLLNNLKKIMMQYAFTDSNKYYVKQGYLPSISKEKEFDYKDIFKEAMAFIGISSNIPTDTKWQDLENINYNTDEEKDNPMLQMLLDRNSSKYVEVPHFPKPGENEAEFIKRKQEAKDVNAKIREENEKIHNQLINKDWENVFKSFIINSARYDAIRLIKGKLYAADDALLSYDAYKLNYKNELIQDYRLSAESEVEYKTESNRNTSAQLRNYIRRVVRDTYKNNTNPQLLKFASIAQNMAGTKYMMLNITGGIANVLTGQTNIAAERFAREYFNEKDWMIGQNLYVGGAISYMSNMYNDKSTTLQDGVIKLANVVDYDRIAELTANDIKGNIKKLRGLLFTPQTAGEHYMQNTVLLTMMKNHRIIKEADGNAKIVSFEMFKREKELEALMIVLNEEERAAYDKFFNDILTDENRRANYNMFNNNVITDFIRTHLTKERMIEFVRKRKELMKEAKKKFEELPDVYSQFELVDGYANLKADADIELKDFAKLVEKVIKVNKKVHGVYDKIGAAKIENEWWGGIVMQFHKHLYPGFKKRYRRHGYYDEVLETIEKGAYNSLMQFINTPYHLTKYKRSQEELDTLQAIQEYCKNAISFITHIRLNYNLLSESERANIRRAYADFVYTGAAVVGAIALTAIAGGDKDNEESIWYNLLMYHADRLASEAFAFTPIGLASEGEKLWSSPVAIWSSCNDLLKTLGFAVQTLLNNDVNQEYMTGRYAGKNKLKVIIGRNIPVYRNIQRIIELPDNNSYYKLGDNALSVIPVKEIGEWIRE